MTKETSLINAAARRRWPEEEDRRIALRDLFDVLDEIRIAEEADHQPRLKGDAAWLVAQFLWAVITVVTEDENDKRN